MDLLELKTEARRSADDSAAAPLYDDEFMAKAASEAEREACIRARLIYDETSDFLQHAVVAGAQYFEPDPLVQVIDAATYTPTGGTARALELTGVDAIRDRDPTFRFAGKPLLLARVGGLCRIWPKVDTTGAGIVALSVYRLPLYDLEDDDDEPEIELKHHAGLVHWMLHKAYQTKDGEQGDAALSEMHLGMFVAQFGARPNADAQRRQAERRRITTKFGGIR